MKLPGKDSRLLDRFDLMLIWGTELSFLSSSVFLAGSTAIQVLLLHCIFARCETTLCPVKSKQIRLRSHFQIYSATQKVDAYWEVSRIGSNFQFK